MPYMSSYFTCQYALRDPRALCALPFVLNAFYQMAIFFLSLYIPKVILLFERFSLSHKLTSAESIDVKSSLNSVLASITVEILITNLCKENNFPPYTEKNKLIVDF